MESSPAPSANAAAVNAPQRLRALDAYRGFVMLAMVSGGLGFSAVAEHFSDEPIWKQVAYQLEHVDWVGCSAWDLIQPSFMFIVGVAMPFSFAARQSRGDSRAAITAHAFVRGAILVALGIFLRSNGREMTNFTFEDVATQIGLGFPIVFLLLGVGWRKQMIAVAAILIGYWLLFALWPIPATVPPGIPDDWNKLPGFAAHWNKHLNPAGYFDQWFLNLFPRPEPFVFNGGGYQTLNFVPSMATMLFGVMTGEFLRIPGATWKKVLVLAGLGLVCLAFGMAVDGHLWPSNGPDWSVAPVVKRIWTPSWAVFSTGWTLLTLSLFLLVIDVIGFRGWELPLTIVGLNSVAMYVMSWLTKPWLKGTLHTHLPEDWFAGTYGPVVESSLALALLWLICWWMYRRKIFLRI